MISFLLWFFGVVPVFLVYILIAVGIVLYLFAELATSRVTQFVASAYLSTTVVRMIGVGLTSLGLFLLGFTYSDDAFKAELQKKSQEVAQINKNAKNISQKVVTQYVYRDKVIKEKGDEIIKYVTTKNDADCNLHNSTVELLNSSAKNELPDATKRTDESPSGVGLSTVTTTVTTNYEKYHEVTNQLKSLQDWIKQQQENNK